MIYTKICAFISKVFTVSTYKSVVTIKLFQIVVETVHKIVYEKVNAI